MNRMSFRPRFLSLCCLSLAFWQAGIRHSSAATVLADNVVVTNVPHLVTVSSSLNILVGAMSTIGSNSGLSVSIGVFNDTQGAINLVHGEGNTVTGQTGFTTGIYNANAGDTSMIFGSTNQVGAGSSYSMAGGYATIVNATAAVSLGRATTANSYASMVIGQYNAPVPGETDPAAKNTWRPADPLFVIGNGTSAAAKSNALVVTKDGTVTINRIPPRGGISMGPYQETPP